MAHEISRFAYVGQPAWHGLGVALPKNESIETWREVAGFNWNVQQAPVLYQNGDVHTFDGRKVLYRSDDGSPLSVVSDDYRVVQPGQILEFFRDLTESQGFEMETAGILRNGSKYFALARTGRESVVGIANDVHKQYVLLATACDGSLSTTAMLTDVRVVCANTLRFAVDGKDEKIKVRHTTTFDADDSKKRLGLLDYDTAMDVFARNMDVLNGIKVGQEFADKFFLGLLVGDPSKREGNTRAVRGLADLQGAYANGPGAVPGTAYGVLNAVTRYVDHERNRNNADGRVTSALFGQGSRVKQKAFNDLMSLAA